MKTNEDAIFEEKVRVNTYECDFNGKWKPASFFQHMTEAAHLHATQLGAGYRELIRRDLTWVHARMKIKFLRFPAIDEIITIHTWPKMIQQKLFFIRDFALLDQNQEQIAIATSAWLIINTTTRRLVPVQRLDLNLPCLEELHGLNETLDKINLPSAGEECLRRIAGYSSVDIVGHVNNSRYPEWICDAFPTGYYQNHQFDWIQINYNHETLPGEEVILFKEPLDENGLWGIQGYNNNHSTSSFESLVKWKN